MLDASAILCLIKREAGVERVRDAMPGALVSVVNLVEVFETVRRQKLDAPRQDIIRTLTDAGTEVIKPTDRTADLAADMISATPPPGHGRISLGDGFLFGSCCRTGHPRADGGTGVGANAVPACGRN